MEFELSPVTKHVTIIQVHKWLDDDRHMRDGYMPPSVNGLQEYKQRLRDAADTLPKDQRHSSDNYDFEGSLPPQHYRDRNLG
jgi:hypothetical protein